MQDVYNNIALQYGAIGVLIAFLIAANIAQWYRRIKIEDRQYDQSVETTAALVELTTLIRSRRS